MPQQGGSEFTFSSCSCRVSRSAGGERFTPQPPPTQVLAGHKSLHTHVAFGSSGTHSHVPLVCRLVSHSPRAGVQTVTVPRGPGGGVVDGERKGHRRPILIQIQPLYEQTRSQLSEALGRISRTLKS